MKIYFIRKLNCGKLSSYSTDDNTARVYVFSFVSRVCVHGVSLKSNFSIYRGGRHVKIKLMDF